MPDGAAFAVALSIDPVARLLMLDDSQQQR